MPDAIWIPCSLIGFALGWYLGRRDFANQLVRHPNWKWLSEDGEHER